MFSGCSYCNPLRAVELYLPSVYFSILLPYLYMPGTLFLLLTFLPIVANASDVLVESEDGACQ